MSTTAQKTIQKPATKKAVVKKVAAKPMRKTTTAKAPIKVAPAKPAKPVKAAKPVKVKKPKLVRDSFTIPKNEFGQIAEMKKKAMGLGIDIKKSELIRAGLLLLTAMSDAAFKKALANVPTLKTGRPGKS